MTIHSKIWFLAPILVFPNLPSFDPPKPALNAKNIQVIIIGQVRDSVGGPIGDLNSQLYVNFIRQKTPERIFSAVYSINKRLSGRPKYYEYYTGSHISFYLGYRRTIKFSYVPYDEQTLTYFKGQIFHKPANLLEIEYYDKYFSGTSSFSLNFLKELHCLLMTIKICKNEKIDCGNYEERAEVLQLYFNDFISWLEKNRPITALQYKQLQNIFQEIK